MRNRAEYKRGLLDGIGYLLCIELGLAIALVFGYVLGAS